MSGTRAPTPDERRAHVVSRLQAQRRVIRAQLGDAPTLHQDFPRSMTMRALTHHPDMFLRAAWDLFGLWRSSRNRGDHS
jgi:hypothetical protein